MRPPETVEIRSRFHRRILAAPISSQLDTKVGAANLRRILRVCRGLIPTSGEVLVIILTSESPAVTTLQVLSLLRTQRPEVRVTDSRSARALALTSTQRSRCPSPSQPPGPITRRPEYPIVTTVYREGGHNSDPSRRDTSHWQASLQRSDAAAAVAVTVTPSPTSNSS
jgi:hypothetical protein